MVKWFGIVAAGSTMALGFSLLVYGVAIVSRSQPGEWWALALAGVLIGYTGWRVVVQDIWRLAAVVGDRRRGRGNGSEVAS